MLSVTAIVVSTSLMVGSCGAGEGDSTVPATTTTTTTTTPATTTTTTPATTTTTTPSPAAGAPVITLAPLTDEEAEVVAALYEARTLAIEVGLDPDAPELDERLDAVYARSGQARGTVEANREFLRTEGLRARVDPDHPWELIIESVTFVEEPYVRADVQVCFIDSNILYEPGGAPDGSDAIVNDDIGASRVLYTLIPEEGRWQLWHAQGLSETALGATQCPADG